MPCGSVAGKNAFVMHLLCILARYKPRPIMLNFLPIMLLSNAQKFACYAQYYDIMPMTTAIMPQVINFIN